MSWISEIGRGVIDGLRGRINYDTPGPGSPGVNQAKVISSDLINGDVNIIDIKAYKSETFFDLMTQVTEIHIFESIVSPVVFAHLEIADAINLQDDFIIDESTYVKIVFQTPGATLPPVDYLFKVNKVYNKRDVPSLSMKTYGVQLISTEALAAKGQDLEGFPLNDTAGKLIKKIINEKIKGAPEISSLLSSKVKKDLAEDIDDGRTVIGGNKLQIKSFPRNRKPFEAIHQLAIVNNKSPEGHSLYTFFENRHGYNFKPIEKLMKDGRKKIKGDQTDAIFFYDSLRNEKQEAVKFRNILAYNVYNSGDNATVGVNTEAKMYNQETGEFTTPVRPDQIDSVTSELTSAQAIRGLDTERRELLTSTEYQHLSENAVKRRQLVLRISQFEAQILIYGDTNLTVGDVIRCNFPRSIGEDKPENSSDTADYIITHLRHMILNTNRPQHIISCNLMRAEPARR